MRSRLLIAAVTILLAAIAIGAVRLLGLSSASPGVPSPSPLAAVPEPTPAATPAITSSVVADATLSARPTTIETSTATPTVSPSAVPTDDPNLLTMTNGAFVRRWTASGLKGSPQLLAQNASVALEPGFRGPVEFVFEMPSIAHLDRIGVTLRSLKAARIEVAVSRDARSFHVLGTLQYAPAAAARELPIEAAADARSVRFVVEHASGSDVQVERMAAYGHSGAGRPGALSGTWSHADSITGSPAETFAGVRGHVPDTLPPHASLDPLATLATNGVLAEFDCGSWDDVWHGAIAGAMARGAGEVLHLAGNGDLLVGYANRRYVLALRVPPAPRCSSSASGQGPTVLVLGRVGGEDPPETRASLFPGYRFEQRLAPLLETADLRRARFAILDSDCNASNDLSPGQQTALLRWVAAGHKLIIRDADRCSSSDYSFLPYRFSTKATGARGARGDTLVLADPSTLGSGPGDGAHFLDTDAYRKNPFQQLGDGDIMETDDPHWCGHLFSTNAAGANGWVHAYARHGRGLIIYDGIDRDDIGSMIPPARRLVQLEYAQSVDAELPCNARVASVLTLYPSVEKQLPSGKAMALRVPMRLVYAAKNTAAQEVTLSIDGDERYRARVSPSPVRLGPGAGVPVLATLELPAGWSGTHAYTVTARGAVGQIARATIRIDGSVALAASLAAQRRVRIYGIHFDVDSARIQPRSEATIAQIAGALAANGAWKLRIEGHTDSDGSANYNRELSLRRARAVVADLVSHYHVDHSRLTPAGFGASHPVASNGSEAGKALNRRVELVRL